MSAVDVKSARSADVDRGLRAYMLGIYNNMTIGLLITSFVAYGIYSLSITTKDLAVDTIDNRIHLTEFGVILLKSPLMFFAMCLPLIFMIGLIFTLERWSVSGLKLFFWAFSASFGVGLSTVLMQYTSASVAQVFFITVTMFAGLSLYGYTTRRDLSGIGTFLLMGLIGVIAASLINIFFASSTMTFIISCVAVVIYAGFTAYDTQDLKNYYLTNGNSAETEKYAVLGAINFYLDFIGIFIHLMRLLGVLSSDD